MSFYKGKKVLVTGHTGFKGTWLCKVLLMHGAQVVGYALEEPQGDNVYQASKIDQEIKSYIGDIRDLEKLSETFDKEQPEIVFHLAAQPIVRVGYELPAYTFEVNIMGTVNVLECIRKTKSVKSFVNITTDKVYENKEWEWGYRENELLKGMDPYSNSKSCSEFVTFSYVKSFFADKEVRISTARAGNVIGGGDFAANRIIPDCVRAGKNGDVIVLRNPHAIRPFQHVLEPIFVYMMIAQKQYMSPEYCDNYNVGPDESDCITVEKLTKIFVEKWGEGLRYNIVSDNGPHEANFLKLDCSHLKSLLGWKSRWTIEQAVEKTVEWHKAYNNNEDIPYVMEKQICEYEKQ